MAGSFTATDPWILARNRYMEDLDEDEKKIFATASLENLFYAASAAQIKHETESKSRAISSKLAPFVSAIDQYGSALDVVSNTYSLVMAPLWGSIRVLLHVARSFEKYFQKLIEMLTRIGDVLPRCRVYQSVVPSHARLIQSISMAYLDVIHFCADAKRTFRKLKKSTTVKFAMKLFWKDFAGEFEGSLNKFRNHIKSVEKEVGTASLIECSDERALARVDRAERDKADQVAERDLILSKLSPIGYIDKHLRARRKRHPGSGSWLRKTVEYKDWVLADRSAGLWCYGILLEAGSGKTILASGLIDALSMDEATIDITIQPWTSYDIISKGITHQDLAFTYYYCDSSDPRSLEARNVIGTLVKELLEQIAITNILKQELISLNKPGIRVAESDELLPILLAVLRHFSKAYIFLDGLDECRKEERLTILSMLNRVFRSDGLVVKIFVTSQQEVDITVSLKEFSRLEVSPHKISSDISSYVKGTVRSSIESGDLLVQTACLESDIISALVDGAQGMFLWVSFQIADLCDATSEYDIREALRTLPKGMATTYARLLHKISSIPANMSLAQRAFKWIICAKRPLVITELTEAIAFQPTDRSWNAEKIPDASRTIQACRNLVVLDETDKTVRLAHHSVRKFLLEGPTQESIPEFHFKLRRASIEAGELCVAYLSFSDFERQLTTSIPDLCRVTGEVPGPSAILDSVRLSPASGHVASGILRVRQRMGIGGTAKQPSSFELAKLVKLRRPAPPNLLEKYLFLKYAMEHWIGHTSDFYNYDPRMWSLFKDLAMNKPMPFDIRVWGDMHGSDGLPYTALFRWAVSAGHLPLLKLLLELPEGSDLQAYCRQDDDEGQSVLHVASRCGHTNVIEQLAKRGYIRTKSGEPLIEAVERGCHGVVRALLDYDLCLEGKVEALYKATGARSEALARMLLDSMFNINMRTNWGLGTLIQAMENDWDEILVTLLRKAISVTDALDTMQNLGLWDPFHEAARRGLVGVVGFLLENGAHVSKNGCLGQTPIHNAAFPGQPGVVQLLIDNGADIEATSREGRTLLNTAARYGYKEAVQILLENGVDVDKQDDSGLTALYLAASAGYLTIVRLLLDSGADLERRNLWGPSVLHVVAHNGHEPIAFLLLQNGIDINTIDENNQTALHHAASNGHSSVMKTLMCSGANVEAKDSDAHTALHLAALNGHVEIVHLLLQGGAEIEVRSGGGTALHLAVYGGYKWIRPLLLKADAQDPESGETALHQATLDRFEAVVRLLLESGTDINSTDGSGQTALHLAAKAKHGAFVQLLLEAGADVHSRDTSGKTALYWAVNYGAAMVVRLLLQKVADANAYSSGKSKIALHSAILFGYQAVVKVLLEHGADVLARDVDDLTPLQLALQHSRTSIADMLIQHGADVAACNSTGHNTVASGASL